MTRFELLVISAGEGHMAAPDAAPVRVERVLDAAADLLVRRGYQRVTIEDIARRAGIGKGTVYLHFRTKEELFLMVLLRIHHRVVAAMVARLLSEPAEVLPGRMVRSLFEDVAADAVTRPLYLGDPEVLGRLTHEAAGTLAGLGARRDAILREHFGLLRAAGLLRTDRSVDEQRYLLAAITSGFYFVDGIGLPYAPGAVRRRAELMEQAVAAVLHAPDPPAGAGAALAPRVAELYRSLNVHIDEEWRARVR
ncbi:MAG: TetR/AcrR family transcriptional regulator [Pseudonocardia sp.]